MPNRIVFNNDWSTVLCTINRVRFDNTYVECSEERESEDMELYDFTLLMHNNSGKVMATQLIEVFPKTEGRVICEYSKGYPTSNIYFYDVAQGYCKFMLVKVDAEGFRYGPNAEFVGNNERINVNWDTLLEGVPEGKRGKTIYHHIFSALREALTKTPSAGCVKSYINSHNNMWIVRRASNTDAFTKIGEHFYETSYVKGLFKKIYRSVSDFDYIWKSVSIAEDITAVNVNGRSQFWYVSCLVPIYYNAIPFNEIERYVIPGSEGGYEHVIVDGERRYVNLLRPGMNLFDKGVQPYSTRIEQVVPADKMFKLGKVDLYSRRDKEEVPFLGWELEACCNLATVGDYNEVAKVFKKQLPYLVMCKSDSSIAPIGFETVSIPATLDAWMESDLEASLDVMRRAPYNMRSFEHQSCGFHVHVSRSALSVLDLQKMERFMHNPDNKNFLEVLANRKNNTYAKFFPKLFNKRVESGANAGDDALIRQSGVYESIQWYAHPKYFLNRIDEHSSAETNLLNFYYFMNEAVSFGSLDSAIADNPDLPTVSFGHYTGVGDRYITDEQREQFLRWLAGLGPYLNKIIRHFFPELGVEAIPDPEEQPQATEKKYLKCGLMKTTLPIGRKNSFHASQSVKGPLGKGHQRYDVLNTKNRSTVEFRLFKGTMNPTTIFRYLEFVDALTRFVATTSATDKGVHYTTFINWVIQDAFNVSRYSNLVAFLVDQNYVERKTIRRKELIKLTSGDGSPNPDTKEKTLSDEGSNKPLFFISSTEEAANLSTVENIPEDEDAFYVEEEDDYYDALNLDDLSI